MSWKDRFGKAWASWIRDARLWILGGAAVLVVLVVLLLPETRWATAAPWFGRLETITRILTPLILLIGVLAALRRVEAAEQGQITDRFTKSIEQLDDKNLATRLGGIYTLERIARDSERDHWTVMEVLCAFLRENFPRGKGIEENKEENHPLLRPDRTTFLAGGIPAGPRRGFISEAYAFSQSIGSAAIALAYLGVAPLATDAQAVCTVLRRREEWAEPPEGLNLAGADLHGADLHGARLEGASFFGADLRGAHLVGAHLNGASLNGAILDGASFHGASLHEARLDGARLVGASLDYANLGGAFLWGATFPGASFQGASLHEARLEGANLGDAEGLRKKQIREALGDAGTKLPDGLKRPAHWTSEGEDEPSPDPPEGD